MAGSNKDVDKKMNTSAKPGGLPPPKGNKADAVDPAKLKGLLDELDSKLDDFFAIDEDAKDAEKHQITQSPLDDVKETPTAQKAAATDKNKTGKIKTEVLAPPAVATKKVDISPTPQATASAATDTKPIKVQNQEETGLSIKKAESEPPVKDATGKTKPKVSAVEAPSESKTTKAPKLKPAAPTTKKAEIKPIDKDVSGEIKQKALETEKPKTAEPVSPPLATPKEKTKKAETNLAPVVDKIPPPKGSHVKVQARPVELKKEPKKSDQKQGKKKHALLKLTFGGIILVGGMIALLIFFQTPDPSHQSQPVTAPTAHKVIKPPAKALETKTTPPDVQSVPQRPETAQSQSDAPPVDEKKSIPSTKPEIKSADEIKDFLQEWKTAWEKSAGKKGDTDAFMSFYSDDFISNSLDKNRWRQDKAEKNKRKEWIRIELDKINIVGPLGNGRYEAKFTLAYQSSNYADTSDQVLILKKEASGWKVIGTQPQIPTSYPYSIHDGSYRALPSAREAVEVYRKMGLEAYWTLVDLGEKGTWYRVFIGYFNNLESARRIIDAKSLTDVKPEETRYANLIGTYAAEDDLQRQSRLVAESGYSSYVIRDDNGKLNLYVGAYGTLKNAEEFSAELNARGIPSRVVER